MTGTRLKRRTIGMLDKRLREARHGQPNQPMFRRPHTAGGTWGEGAAAAPAVAKHCRR